MLTGAEVFAALALLALIVYGFLGFIEGCMDAWREAKIYHGLHGCPKCGAGPNEPCRGTRSRGAYHWERMSGGEHDPR